ncbi:hypothetical protein VTL71DRAFT_7269 [Oculimacula yallundae]|uniref:2EXR domain-containing protein n=1 Tax=Oculimacula yallundae TaxID=86028 RepID=A0ABR4BXP5_9HELO
MIWKLSFQPRVVEMEFATERGFFASCKLPVALQVCGESRDMAQKSYVPCFKSLWYPRFTRFNFDMDTLHISFRFFRDAPAFFSILNDKEIASIRFIAIDESDFSKHRKRFFNALKALTALEEVTVVYDFYWSFRGILEEAGYDMSEIEEGESEAMQFFSAPPPTFRRLGIYKADKGWCKTFSFLKNLKGSFGVSYGFTRAQGIWVSLRVNTSVTKSNSHHISRASRSFIWPIASFLHTTHLLSLRKAYSTHLRPTVQIRSELDLPSGKTHFTHENYKAISTMIFADKG